MRRGKKKGWEKGREFEKGEQEKKRCWWEKKIIKSYWQMREKRYYKDMKGTQGKGDNNGSICRSWSRIEGNGKRELYNGF